MQSFTWSLHAGRNPLDSLQAKIKETPAAIESYLIDHGCTDVRYSEDLEHSEHIFSVTLNDLKCQLWIQKAWLKLETHRRVDERLARLEVIPFTQYNSFPWVGLKGNKDVIERMPKRKGPNFNRQHPGIALTLKKLLDSRIPIHNGRMQV